MHRELEQAAFLRDRDINEMMPIRKLARDMIIEVDHLTAGLLKQLACQSNSPKPVSLTRARSPACFVRARRIQL